MCESFIGQQSQPLNLSPPAIETACGCLDALALLLGCDPSRRFALASRNPPLVVTLVAGECAVAVACVRPTVPHVLEPLYRSPCRLAQRVHVQRVQGDDGAGRQR